MAKRKRREDIHSERFVIDAFGFDTHRNMALMILHSLWISRWEECSQADLEILDADPDRGVGRVYWEKLVTNLAACLRESVEVSLPP